MHRYLFFIFSFKKIYFELIFLLQLFKISKIKKSIRYFLRYTGTLFVNVK